MAEQILREQFVSDNLHYDLDVDVYDGNGEDEVTENHHPTYDINWYGVNLDVEYLVRRFDSKWIYSPNFQNQFAWDQKQASRFIESVLIGLPLPSLFLYRDYDKKYYYVIDGLQRLVTLSAFKKGYWPNSDSFPPVDEPFSGPPFKLVGLPNGSKFKEKSYDGLYEQDQEQLNETLIRVLFIEQRSPDDDHSTAFHIFERFNSGGTPLQAQEMRNALYDGKFRQHLYDLSQTNMWDVVFGEAHKRAKDQELILRFLALLNDGENYHPPMKLFLNKFMNKHKNADKETLAKFRTQFTHTLERIHEALGNDAFRPNEHSRAFSAPYFDAFMVAVASDKNAQSKSILNAYKSLKENPDFISCTRADTTDSKAVNVRIKMVKEAINAKC